MSERDLFDYCRFLDRVIDEGITSVIREYTDAATSHKREGAIDGFNRCRGRTPAELAEIYRNLEQELKTARAAMQDASHHSEECVTAPEPPETIKVYWKVRYAQLQVEWVCNVMSYAMQYNGTRSQPILAGHGHPTSRAAMLYARIVGVAPAIAGARS